MWNLLIIQNGTIYTKPYDEPALTVHLHSLQSQSSYCASVFCLCIYISLSLNCALSCGLFIALYLIYLNEIHRSDNMESSSYLKLLFFSMIYVAYVLFWVSLVDCVVMLELSSSFFIIVIEVGLPIALVILNVNQALFIKVKVCWCNNQFPPMIQPRVFNSTLWHSSSV